MGIFDAIGGRPDGAPERAFDVGEKFGAYRQMNSAGAKLQEIMDARQKGIADRQTNAVNEQKVKSAKILGILQDGITQPEGHPKRVIAEQLAQTIQANPAFMGSLGFKSGLAKEAPLTHEQKRVEYARKKDMDLAMKSANDLRKADDALNQLDSIFQKAVPNLPKDAPDAIYGGTVNKALAKLGFGSEDLRSYEDLRGSLSTVFSKGIFGEVGVLTDKDREVAMKALPQATDSVTVYENKMNTLRGIMRTAQKNYENKRQAYVSGIDFEPEEFSQDGDLPSNADLSGIPQLKGKKILSVTPYEGK